MLTVPPYAKNSMSSAPNSSAPRSAVLGTAGHIDHGKTSLIRSLTGIDTDRLKEEKKRGITIELGFAHLLLKDTHFGIVDVPGHERFIRAMVAGAGGIDLVLLVIAADEGIMPQTREHLDICELLGVKKGVIALSKCDLVDEEWLSLVTEDISQQLEGSFLEDAPLVPVSSETGFGLDKMREVISELADGLEEKDLEGRLRLPLDRVFSIKGFGTVVTGTLTSGTLHTGDEILVMPGDTLAPVRRIQVHGETVESAIAGQRTAVNLAGVDRQQVARGEIITHPHTLQPSPMIDVELKLLSSTRKALKKRSKVLFHQGTRQQQATCILLSTDQLGKGESCLAQLRFDEPVVLLPDDRFILRGFAKQENYGTTIGGGRVLRVLASKIKHSDTEAIGRLRKIASATDRGRLEDTIWSSRQRGLSLYELLQRLPWTRRKTERELEALLNSRSAIRFDKENGAVIHGEHFELLSTRLINRVDGFHERHPEKKGISKEELRSQLGLMNTPRLFSTLLSRLEQQDKLISREQICQRPEHKSETAAASLQPLAQKLKSHIVAAGLAAPRRKELCEALRQPDTVIGRALQLLLDERNIVRIGELYFAKDALDGLQMRLKAYLEANDQITAAEFKVLVGQSRKFTIPLAEYFDGQKLTLRIGDIRRLRG
jgi:selenocysteine-specific elongation factor